jgi:hypothetical protein
LLNFTRPVLAGSPRPVKIENTSQKAWLRETSSDAMRAATSCETMALSKAELSQYALIAFLPFPGKFLIQSIEIDFKILRRNQQVFELDRPRDQYYFHVRNHSPTADFAVFERPIHLVVDPDACRLANVFREGRLPLGSNYGCTHIAATFAPALIVCKPFNISYLAGAGSPSTLPSSFSSLMTEAMTCSLSDASKSINLTPCVLRPVSRKGLDFMATLWHDMTI